MADTQNTPTETKPCPRCASEVGAAAKVCPHCRYSFRFKASKMALTVAAVVVVIVIAGAVGLYVKHKNDSDRAYKECNRFNMLMLEAGRGKDDFKKC